MANPLHIEYVAKQHLVAEIMCLIGADCLNVAQTRLELEAMSLEQLGRYRDDILNELDERFCCK